MRDSPPGLKWVRALAAEWRRCCQPSASEFQNELTLSFMVSSFMALSLPAGGEPPAGHTSRHRNFDLARQGVLGLGNAQREHPVSELGLDLVGIEFARQREAAAVA